MDYGLPDDFPQRLRRFQRESGLAWPELGLPPQRLAADRGYCAVRPPSITSSDPVTKDDSSDAR